MSIEDSAESRSKETLLEWFKGLGLPAASLLVSGAIFVFQSQQQAFERQLSNVEDGYRFYFEHRTSLERHIDADQEETLLKLISNTFPNVFCNVRADLHARVASAEAQDTPNGFGEDDRTLLLAMINSRDAPERAPLSASFEMPAPWAKPAKPEKCAPLDALNKSAEAGSAAGAAAGATAPITQESAQPAEQKQAEASAPAAPPAASAALDLADKRVASSVLADAAQGLRAKARAFAQTTDPRLFRVFFHVRNDGVRAPEIFDPLRAPMAMNGFRAMRGVEQVATAPNNPQVRYFGPDESARAGELAAMLNEYFASEKLTFQTVAIGDQYPNLPRTTLEVWLPDPAAAAPAPGLGAKISPKVGAAMLDGAPKKDLADSLKIKRPIKPGL